MYKALIVITLALLLSSCTTSKMSSLDWIEGTWKNPNLESAQGEIWKKTQDGYLGKAWSVQANDTIWSETMTILQKGDSLLLEVIHPSETTGKPVYFEEVYTSSVKFTFENRAHDWPHFITYWREGDGLLKAHVGSYELGEAELWFEWERVD